MDFQDCLVEYNNHGIRFSYPDIWELTEDADGQDIVLTVSSTESCFWTLRILPACPPPPQVVDSCVEAFREEYDEVDVESTESTLAEMPAYSRDLEFFCMELLNAVALRSVRTSDFTLLVWWQATQTDLGESRSILDHMSASVRACSLLD